MQAEDYLYGLGYENNHNRDDRYPWKLQFVGEADIRFNSQGIFIEYRQY